MKQSLKNAQEAEAVVQFKGNKDADFYEVYEKRWRQLEITNWLIFYNYLSTKVSRSASAQGTTQELKVVAVGKKWSSFRSCNHNL